MPEIDLPARSVAPAGLSPVEWTVAHDYAFADGGAEAVTRWICHDLLPGSALHYLTGDPAVVARMATAETRRVLSVGRRGYRPLAAVTPALVRRVEPVQGHLLASSYAFASGLRAEGRKVIYCHSPLRQAWSGADRYAGHGPLAERIGSRVLGPGFRRFDRTAALEADRIIATSTVVRERVRSFYGRDAEIIPPPVDAGTFFADVDQERGDAFVWAGRITEPYKQLGIVIEAFRALPGLRLVVVGEGRDRARLEASAPANVEFVGWRSRVELGELYREARAVVFPSEDDFGLVPVEAMACGTPVIAYGAGGALDTVEHGVTGVLFHEQTPDGVRRALEEFERLPVDPVALAARAADRWGRNRFRRRMTAALLDTLR